MRRRNILLLTLVGILLLPGSVLAQDEVLPSPSTSPSPSAPPSPSPSLIPVVSGLEPEAAASPQLALGHLPEPDFIVGDWELQVVPWRRLWLNGGPVLPVETIGPQDKSGVPMRPLGPGRKLVYNPTVLAQQGMKRLDSYVQTGNKVHLRQARKYADALERISDGGRKRRWIPHSYGYGVHDPGWVNANSHGLALSFLSRYYSLTGATEKRKQAELMLAAFEQRPQNERWFADVTNAGYIWFEHWPNGRNDHTLNAHLNAMFGLYDYWRATGSPLAEQYFLGGAATVRAKLYRFRRKEELSRYSLASTTGSLHYHETHVAQLRTLARMTGDDWFAKQADLFERDERAWKVKYRGAKP